MTNIFKMIDTRKKKIELIQLYYSKKLSGKWDESQTKFESKLISTLGIESVTDDELIQQLEKLSDYPDICILLDSKIAYLSSAIDRFGVLSVTLPPGCDERIIYDMSGYKKVILFTDTTLYIKNISSFVKKHKKLRIPGMLVLSSPIKDELDIDMTKFTIGTEESNLYQIGAAGTTEHVKSSRKYLGERFGAGNIQFFVEE